jgi:hypothetical protein
MADFVEAARLDQTPPGTSTVVTIAGRSVALFNIDGNIYSQVVPATSRRQSTLGGGHQDVAGSVHRRVGIPLWSNQGFGTTGTEVPLVRRCDAAIGAAVVRRLQ